MIRTQDLTPKIYTKMSRDFQYLGRLFDLTLNAAKTNSDVIYSMPVGDSSDGDLTNLLAYTLGFKPKHKYNSKQLNAICKVLIYIMRNKGSIEAITIAVNALLNAEGIVDYLDYTMDQTTNTLTLFLPETLSDFTLIKDLMEYITPAGVGYKIVKELKETRSIETVSLTTDTIEIFRTTSNEAYENIDLSTLIDPTNKSIRDPTKSATDPTNYRYYSDADIAALPGASMNTTILTLEEIKKLCEEA